jgi:hypothetical protein
VSEDDLEKLVVEAFAAGQEQMRNRAAVAAMETVRAQAQFLHPINLMGSVGKSIADLEIREFPRKDAA